jgi:single-stranded DNA-binding protein
MTTSNPNNLFIIRGNLTKDARILDDKDGNHTVFLTVAVRNNFRTKDKNNNMVYPTEFINVQSKYWNNDHGNKAFDYVKERSKKGQNVSLTGHLMEHNIAEPGEEAKFIRHNIYDSIIFGPKRHNNDHDNEPSEKSEPTKEKQTFL